LEGTPKTPYDEAIVETGHPGKLALKPLALDHHRQRLV
jgi:hypothetical protein